jgi:AcrR family transcriptional regulator
VVSTSRPNLGPAAGPANRRALIAAAREVFTESGYAAPLSAVARKAGVGQGSLYRHFPDRVALALAVFDENVHELELSSAPDTVTLDALIDLIIGQAVVSTAFTDLIISHQDDERVQQLGARVQSLIGVVVAREKHARRMRRSVSTDDVFLAISMVIAFVGRTPEGERIEVARRGWALFHGAFAVE